MQSSTRWRSEPVPAPGADGQEGAVQLRRHGRAAQHGRRHRECPGELLRGGDHSGAFKMLAWGPLLCVQLCPQLLPQLSPTAAPTGVPASCLHGAHGCAHRAGYVFGIPEFSLRLLVSAGFAGLALM